MHAFKYLLSKILRNVNISELKNYNYHHCYYLFTLNYGLYAFLVYTLFNNRPINPPASRFKKEVSLPRSVYSGCTHSFVFFFSMYCDAGDTCSGQIFNNISLTRVVREPSRRRSAFQNDSYFVPYTSTVVEHQKPQTRVTQLCTIINDKKKRSEIHRDFRAEPRSYTPRSVFTPIMLIKIVYTLSSCALRKTCADPLPSFSVN